MIIKQYEAILFLEGYLIEPYKSVPRTRNRMDADYNAAKDDALERCSKAFEDVKRDFVEMFGSVMGDRMTIVGVKFIEFDSTNPAHACGYFDVSVEGSEESHNLLSAAVHGE